MNDFERRRNAEKERLAAIYSDFSGHRLEALQGLVQEAAYLYALLQDLHAEVAESGAVEHYQNGRDQHGLKPSAALSALLQAEKTYTGVMARLTALLPAPTKKHTEDALDAFLRAYEDPGNGPTKAQRLMAEIEAAADAAEEAGDAEREISQQIARTRAARPDVVAASPQELQERLQRS